MLLMSLQSCLTLCDPMDCSLPGSSIHGIFQARVLEWGAIAFSGGLPYFFQFKSEFGDKEFVIWATVSSHSCFYWLYRVSPIFGCKYNQSDFSVDHLVMSLCRVLSCVVGSGCLLWPVCSLGKTLLAFALLRFVHQGQICLLLQISLDFCIPVPWKGNLFLMLNVEVFVGLHRTIQLPPFQHYWLGHRLGLLWYWMVCLGNEQRSFCSWDCIKYFILDSSVD